MAHVEDIGSEDSSSSSSSESDYYIDDETGEKVYGETPIFKAGEEAIAKEFAEICANFRRGRLRGANLGGEEEEEEKEKPKPKPAPQKKRVVKKKK